MSAPVVPLSSIAQVSWPAVAIGNRANLLSILHQFAHSEWWPEERITQCQFRQLARLFRHAYDRLPFYRQRLAAAGYRPDQVVTAELWSRIPVLSRREVQEHREAIVCADVPRGHGTPIVEETSGSMGMPLKAVNTQLGGLFWSAITLREMLWHRRDFRLKFATIRRDQESRAFPPDGRAFPNWCTPFADIFPTGPAVLLDNRTTAAEQADWLLREEPDYLLSSPAIMHELGRYFSEHGLRLARLKWIGTMGEVVSPALRADCRRAFGLGIADMYSATETGYLALQCPRSEHYHVQSECVLLEVLNEAGRPCAPGEVGTVVVTPLLNFAMPLIRYEIGDYATPGHPCACGRGLSVLQEIHGRTRDLLMSPTGERRYAWIGMGTFAEIPEVVQFQVVQKTLWGIEVKLVVRRPLSAEREAEIRHRLASTMGEQFAFTFTYHDVIPRTPSGKYFTFVSELPG